jgi:hypothetical protein
MKKAIVLYLHVHQPFRIRHYTIFDTGKYHNYFDANYDNQANNERIIHKVTEKSYVPTNDALMDLLSKHPEFKVSLSITGTLLEQHLSSQSGFLLFSGRIRDSGGNAQEKGRTAFRPDTASIP